MTQSSPHQASARNSNTATVPAYSVLAKAKAYSIVVEVVDGNTTIFEADGGLP